MPREVAAVGGWRGLPQVLRTSRVMGSQGCDSHHLVTGGPTSAHVADVGTLRQSLGIARETMRALAHPRLPTPHHGQPPVLHRFVEPRMGAFLSGCGYLPSHTHAPVSLENVVRIATELA